MMGMQIFLFFSMYPVLFILYFVYRTYRGEKNGYLFGVRVKQEWCGNEEIGQMQLQYQKQLKRYFIVMLIVPLISFFIPYFSIIFTIWLIWLFAAIVVIMIPFVRANKKMLAWKRARGLQQEHNIQYTEIKYAGEVRCVKGLPYLLLTIPVIAAAVAAIFLIPKDFFVLSVTIMIFASINPLIYILARWMDRQKVEVISTDSEVNLNFARAKKNVWNRCWLYLTLLNTVWTLFMFGVCLMQREAYFSGLALWGSVLYGIFTFVMIAVVWKKMVKIENAYREKRDLPDLADDDKNWIFGMFYYNKNDKHTMVTARNGLGATMNMATPFGMGVNIFSGIVLLIVPVCCVWMIFTEFTPIQLHVENDVILARHLKIDYEIPLDEIASVEKISELPKWSKTNGTGMENLCKGTYFIRNEGKCQVFLNPKNTVFLKIATAENTYYLGGNSDAQTKIVEQAIRENLD